MSIDYHWVDEAVQKTIIIRPERSWSWLDFDHARQGIHAMIAGVEHDVYFIIDYVNKPRLVSGRSALREFQDTINNMPRNLSGIYIAQAPPLLYAIHVAIHRLASNRILRQAKMVSSIERALAAIDERTYRPSSSG